jgi:toluene monooxygenase electron transfer component
MTSLARADDLAELIAPAADRCAVTVEARSGTFAFDCAPGETLLYAGLAHGLTLPHECATGTCGTCRARVMSGEVDIAWEEAPGAAKLKRDKGDVLLCQTRALGDCVLRVPSDVLEKPVRHQIPAARSGVVENLRRLTSDVTHFEIALAEPMDFDAGQFVVVEAPGLQGARAYSMVNHGSGLERIELVVKRKPGGGFGDWIAGPTAEGAKVEVFGPLGRATFHPDEDRDLLMIAGGSGIAGMMSILARAGEEDYFRTHKGYVFFGVRTLADGFYLEQFARSVDRGHGNLEVTLALSHEDLGGVPHPEHGGVKLAYGFVHEVAAAAMAGRYDGVMAYVAGPPPMVDGAIRSLIVGGVGRAAIRYDKFG